MDFDGITMSTAAISAIVGGVGTWLKMRKIPQPLETKEADRFVTCDQCAEHRKAINARIDDIGPALGRVFKKLDENDKRAEERAQATHRRLDPFIQELGAVRGKMEMIEKAAINSTMGGEK